MAFQFKARLKMGDYLSQTIKTINSGGDVVMPIPDSSRPAYASSKAVRNRI